MVSQEVRVVNPSGIHARPASLLVKMASGFKSRVMLENLSKEGKTGDAKSILSVMGLGMSCGSGVRITVEGADEAEALAALVAFVEGGCGE